MARQPAINDPIQFTWNGMKCVVVNGNLDRVYLCREIGSTTGIFSVLKSVVADQIEKTPPVTKEQPSPNQSNILAE